MKIILFDIDRTLLDTEKFTNKIHELNISTLQLSLEAYQDKLSKYINTIPSRYHFDYLDLVAKIAPTQDLEKKLLHQFNTQKSLYPSFPEIHETLTALSNLDYTIGIYSEGSPRFQHQKLKMLNISNFIDPKHIYITQDKRTPNYIKSIPSSYIVDDNPDVINILQAHDHIKPIHIHRLDTPFPTTSPSIKSLLKITDNLH